MSDINLIKNLRNKLDLLEFESMFDEAIEATGIYEELAALFEASPLLKTFGSDPEGTKLAKFLHDDQLVSDRARLVPYKHEKHPKVTNLQLYDFKTHYDNFIVFHGPNGWAAFKPKTEYLRPKLDDPTAHRIPVRNRRGVIVDYKPYDPSRDPDLVYIMYASLKDGADIKIHEFTATRGGRYGHKEKPEAGPNISDEIKKFVGGTKPDDITVYRLEDRDAPDLSSLPPERFSGRRSRKLGTAGASVQRAKVNAREKLRRADPLKSEDDISARLFKVAPVVMQKVAKLFLNRDGDTSNLYDDVSDHLNNIKNQPYDSISDTDQFKSIWKEAVSSALGSGNFMSQFANDIAAYRKAHPYDKISDSDLILSKLMKGEKSGFKELFKSIREELYYKLK